MPKFIEPELEVDIKRLSKENYSIRKIQEKLKEEQVNVCIMTICRIINNVGIRRQALNKRVEKHLAGHRSEFSVTLDEALIYLDDSNGQSPICYVKRGEQVPEHWVLENDKSFKRGFMVVGIMTGRGTVPLIRVPSATKINAQYYVDYVLRPLFTEHLPRLYGKVFFYHDKATSHTADLVRDYLEEVSEELGITYLDKEDIPVKCPDGMNVLMIHWTFSALVT